MAASKGSFTSAGESYKVFASAGVVGGISIPAELKGNSKAAALQRLADESTALIVDRDQQV